MYSIVLVTINFDSMYKRFMRLHGGRTILYNFISGIEQLQIGTVQWRTNQHGMLSIGFSIKFSYATPRPVASLFELAVESYRAELH